MSSSYHMFLLIDSTPSDCYNTPEILAEKCEHPTAIVLFQFTPVPSSPLSYHGSARSEREKARPWPYIKDTAQPTAQPDAAKPYSARHYKG